MLLLIQRLASYTNTLMTSCPICNSVSVMQHTIINTYVIKRCSHCNYIFVDPRPKQKEIDNYYKNFDYKDADLSENRIRSDARISLKFISKYIKSTDTLLDLGCGRGYFMDEAKNQGWNTEGIDYSNKIVAYAREKLKLNVIKSDIYKFTSKNKYQLITMNQVIEHVLDIDKLLEKIVSLLEPGGFIYIATPNIQSASARVFGNEFEYLIPPEHINYFSIETLKKLLAKYNFRVLGASTWGYPENLAGIIKRILKPKKNERTLLSHSFPQKMLEQADNNNSIKYFLFDKMFCQNTYKLLDLINAGINLQLIAQTGIK